MSYVNDNLMPNERVLFTARVHPAVFLPSFVVFFITVALFIYTVNNGALVSQVDTSASQVRTFNLFGSMMLFYIGFLFLYSIRLGIQALVAILTTEFAVTNRRVITKRGFIRRHTHEMLLPKIESVSVSQPVLGRLLNFGTVTVTGTGGTKENFKSIVEPVAVRKKITQIIEGYMQYQQTMAANS